MTGAWAWEETTDEGDAMAKAGVGNVVVRHEWASGAERWRSMGNRGRVLALSGALYYYLYYYYYYCKSL